MDCVSTVVAGTNFGTGSSREMAVWGLLRAAKDASQEGNLVIVAGSGMGNIFRSNAINNGLHIVLTEAGAKIRIPSCGHCFLNMAEDGLESGEVGVVPFTLLAA